MAGKLLSAGGGGARQTTPTLLPSLDRRRKETKDFEQEKREREVGLFCESCNDKTHTIPGYYNKKCKNKQQGIKLLQ